MDGRVVEQKGRMTTVAVEIWKRSPFEKTEYAMPSRLTAIENGPDWFVQLTGPICFAVRAGWMRRQTAIVRRWRSQRTKQNGGSWRVAWPP